MKITRTNSENPDFQNLVKLLDAYLAEIDGDNHAFYHQFNGIAQLNHCIVVYIDNKAVACGAIKEYNETSAEVKRMFTLPEYRGNGIASKLLSDLENWGKELGFQKTILETGKKQVDAVALYQKSGYKLIPNYGQYAAVDDSVCFEKTL